MKCRICHGSDLIKFLDLGNQALTGYFPLPGEVVERAPLVLVRCQGCGLVQLERTVAPSLLYGEHYGYRSSLNQSMVDHLKDVATTVKNFVSLTPDDLVVDIGSNDGTFLKNFDCHKVGIDPTAGKFRQFYDSSTTRISSLFKNGLLPKRARVITSIAMFYDIEDPVQFATDVYDSLASDGIWLVEVANFPYCIRMGIYDTVCHEHLEYYSMTQLKRIMDMVGFHIIDFSFNKSNGGSTQLIMSKNEGERKFSLYEDPIVNMQSTYDDYAYRVYRHRDNLREFLIGKDVAGFGASTKGNVLIQFCDIDLPFIIDVNPDKWGHVTPGSRIPIVLDGEAEFYLVFPWHFRDGILSKNEDKNFIFPFPKIEEVSCALSSIAQ